MILYHATYGAVKEDIRTHGLCRSRIRQKAWEDCSSDYIYLCLDADCAVSFCEASEDIPESWLDDIVLAAINTEDLDAMMFSLDENIINDARLMSYQYRGDIPASAITFINRRNAV